MSSRILLATVGTGHYSETNYLLEKKSFSSQYSFHALDALLQYDEIHVMVTRGSKKKCGEEIRNLLGEKLHFIHIPNGDTKKEIWTIFERVIKAIPEKGKITVDITHGFRSLSFIASIIAIYLRSCKGVEIENIFYGAYDAEKKNRTPFISLKETLELMDWFYSARNFTEYGYAAPLGNLLFSMHQRIYKDPDSQKGEKKPRLLANLGKQLISLDQMIDLAQPLEIQQKSSSILRMLKESFQEVKTWAKPAVEIYDELEEALKKLSYSTKGMVRLSDLEKQRALVQWYQENNHYSTAISLAREVMVNRMLFALGVRKEEKYRDNKVSRKIAEDILNTKANLLQSEKKEISEEEKDILSLWNALRDVRNLINHHGFNTTAQNLDYTSLSKILARFYSLLFSPSWKEVKEL